MPERKTISLVIPMLDELAALPSLMDAVERGTAGLGHDVEIVCVDDGSTDGTGEWLDARAAIDPRVRVVHLARNFGKEIATTAGVHHASGDACLMMDADLEHPPERIREFVQKWEAGAEVVVGVRRGHAGGFVRNAGSWMFYRLMQAVSDTPLTPHATDFRLIDRVVIDEFNRFTERRRLTRALIDWLGFRRAYVEFDTGERQNGTSRFSFFGLVRLAGSSLVSNSFFPLRIAGYLGLFITLTSGALGLFILVEKYFLNDPWDLNFSGPAILAVINLFLIGIVLTCLGLIALYIANIHAEVTNRPLYAVRRRVNMTSDMGAEVRGPRRPERSEDGGVDRSRGPMSPGV